MTQGELYKKLSPMFDGYFDDRYEFADILKVLDEAKKDFPQYEAETTDIDAASKAILSHAKFIQKVYEWKAKWFGSEQP